MEFRTSSTPWPKLQQHHKVRAWQGHRAFGVPGRHLLSRHWLHMGCLLSQKPMGLVPGVPVELPLACTKPAQ